MAGRGPAPKAASRRARTNQVMAERVVPYEPADQPQLPDGVDWPEATIEWWNMWARHPLSTSYSDSDWAFLQDTALLHAACWGEERELKWLPELRLRVAKFGATPEDRARLRIVFADADERESRAPGVPVEQKPRGARERFGGVTYLPATSGA